MRVAKQLQRRAALIERRPKLVRWHKSTKALDFELQRLTLLMLKREIKNAARQSR